jgi:hypothetical protein
MHPSPMLPLSAPESPCVLWSFIANRRVRAELCRVENRNVPNAQKCWQARVVVGLRDLQMRAPLNARAPLRRRQGRSERHPRRPSTACQPEGGRREERPARSPARGRGRPQHPSARPRRARRPRQRPRAPASDPAVSASTAVASPQATSACRRCAVGRELPTTLL